MARDPGALDVWSDGAGEPLLLLRTALSAQHLVPLSRQPVLGDHFRLLTYDRRGYGASPPAQGPGSLAREAAEAATVLDDLGAKSAHVLGDSYSVALALELALAHPGRVRSLVLIEPPPALAPGSERFLAVNRQLMDIYESEGVDAALETFLGGMDGPDWRAAYDGVIPGISRRIERDASAFFAHDIPALLDWSLDPARAARIDCPVLYLEGAENGPLFTTVHDWLLELLPQARPVSIPGAGHSVSFTHPEEVAVATAAFLREQAGVAAVTPPESSSGLDGSRARSGPAAGRPSGSTAR
ncbi:alpha/beta fold hydrolase [Brachybacterium vulturis]|uniref:alpha/beta fold hydrolase n=1 Tax=Brachybacterium vulturis TaxID=2017484 RepID=UPI003736CB28